MYYLGTLLAKMDTLYAGGVYLDTDFLVVRPLTEYVAHLDKNDFVAYEAFGQNCSLGQVVGTRSKLNRVQH